MNEGNQALLDLLEVILKEATEPLDCNDLYDMAAIKEVAPSANRVSDYLGVLFRRGLLSRVPSDRSDPNSRARWKYLWKGRPLPAWRKELEPETYKPKAILDRPNIYISDEGANIVIQLPGLSITIKKEKIPE